MLTGRSNQEILTFIKELMAAGACWGADFTCTLGKGMHDQGRRQTCEGIAIYGTNLQNSTLARKQAITGRYSWKNAHIFLKITQDPA